MKYENYNLLGLASEVYQVHKQRLLITKLESELKREKDNLEHMLDKIGVIAIAVSTKKD